jgi:MarR family transcriptional regulator, organic hydroperoxide resistance regulator
MSPLRSEIKQTKPFSSLEEETAVALARTTDQVARRFDGVLKQHGLTGTQYNVLRILRGAGKAGLPCSELGERMISRDPDITRLLDRMERAGLCNRARDQKDRRVILVKISDKGLKTVNQLDQPITELNRAMLGHMGKGRLRSLLDLLDAVRNG